MGGGGDAHLMPANLSIALVWRSSSTRRRWPGIVVHSCGGVCGVCVCVWRGGERGGRRARRDARVQRTHSTHSTHAHSTHTAHFRMHTQQRAASALPHGCAARTARTAHAQHGTHLHRLPDLARRVGAHVDERQPRELELELVRLPKVRLHARLAPRLVFLCVVLCRVGVRARDRLECVRWGARARACGGSVAAAGASCACAHVASPTPTPTTPPRAHTPVRS